MATARSRTEHKRFLVLIIEGRSRLVKLGFLYLAHVLIIAPIHGLCHGIRHLVVP